MEPQPKAALPFPPLQPGRGRAAEPGCPATLPLAKEASSASRWITAALCWFLPCKRHREKKQLRFCAVQGLSLQRCSWPVVMCHVFILSCTGNQRGSAIGLSRSRSKARLVLTQTGVGSLDKPRRPSQSIVNSHVPALLRGAHVCPLNAWSVAGLQARSADAEYRSPSLQGHLCHNALFSWMEQGGGCPVTPTLCPSPRGQCPRAVPTPQASPAFAAGCLLPCNGVK